MRLHLKRVASELKAANESKDVLHRNPNLYNKYGCINRQPHTRLLEALQLSFDIQSKKFRLERLQSDLKLFALNDFPSSNEAVPEPDHQVLQLSPIGSARDS